MSDYPPNYDAVALVAALSTTFAIAVLLALDLWPLAAVLVLPLAYLLYAFIRGAWTDD